MLTDSQQTDLEYAIKLKHNGIIKSLNRQQYTLCLVSSENLKSPPSNT